MKFWWLILLLEVCGLSFVLGQDVDGDSPVWMAVNLETEENQWIETGNVTFNSLSSGKIDVPFSTVGDDVVTDLQRKSESRQFAQFKTVVKTSSGKIKEFRSFAKACAVLQAPVLLSVHLNHAGSVMAVSTSPTVNCDDVDSSDVSSRLRFNYVFKLPEAGPTPDTASYINRLDREREAKERGDTQDNRSFFGKYWMYIVPMALFVLLSGSTNSEPPAAPATR